MIDRVVLLTGERASTYWVYYKSGRRRPFNINDMLPMTVLNFILNKESKVEYRDDPNCNWNLINPTIIRRETWK